MKKRVLAVILTLAMTASLAAGCGSGEESGSDEDTITLSFLDKHPEEEYKGYFEQAIADFEEQNPGVEIEYENIRRSRKSLVSLQQAVTCRISSSPGAESV